MSDRRTKLYASLGLDQERQGAQCVAVDMIDQGRSAEEAELYLRGSQWLDARFPDGWGTTTTVKGNAVFTKVLYHAIVPR